MGIKFILRGQQLTDDNACNKTEEGRIDRCLLSTTYPISRLPARKKINKGEPIELRMDATPTESCVSPTQNLLR